MAESAPLLLHGRPGATTHRRSAPTARLATLASALLAAGCAHSSTRAADRFYQAGEYRRAAVAYDAALSTMHGPARPDRALARLGWAQLLAATEGRVIAGTASPTELERARRAFVRLRESYPHSPYRRQADAATIMVDHMLAAQRSASAARQRVERLQLELERCREQSRAANAALQVERHQVKAETDGQDETAEEVHKLEARIAQQRRRIKALQRSLNALKRIDMQRSH